MSISDYPSDQDEDAPRQQDDTFERSDVDAESTLGHSTQGDLDQPDAAEEQPPGIVAGPDTGGNPG